MILQLVIYTLMSVARADVVSYPVDQPWQFQTVRGGAEVFLMAQDPITKEPRPFAYDFSNSQITSPNDVAKLKYAEAIQVNETGTFAVVSTSDDSEYLWDVKKQVVTPLEIRSDYVAYYEFTDDGKYLYMMSYPQGKLRLTYFDLA